MMISILLFTPNAELSPRHFVGLERIVRRFYQPTQEARRRKTTEVLAPRSASRRKYIINFIFRIRNQNEKRISHCFKLRYVNYG
jgi:hypothetical protein